MRNFKLNPLAIAMALAALPVGVYAQDSAPTSNDGNIEEVVVTGSFRDSLANAQNIKRNSSGVVDAIVASDIAEFPDNNLAESLQRVPGVAITRSGGEGRNITVRGLGAQYTRVRLNGMETISTTGGTDAVGGNNRGRGFDFNTFSSDLFSSLVVHKTNSAEIEEGSLGATVDLRAARPFDYDGFVMSASGQLGYNDLSEKTDPSASFLVSNTFADGKFGALFSLAYSERSVQDEGASTVRWDNVASQKFGKYQGAAIDATNEINSSFRPRIPRYDSYHHTMERLGSSLSLQFRPNDSSEISFDALKATFDATRQEVFMEGSLNGGQNANVNVLDYAIQGETLVYAKMEGARLLSENRYDDMSTDFSQYTLSFKQEFTDKFRMNAMIGTTESDYENPIQNTVLMQADNQEFTYDFSDYNNPMMVFGDAAYDKSSWKVTGVRQRPQSTINKNDAGQVNFEYDLNEAITFKVGADSKDFTFDTNQFAYASEGANGVDVQSNADFITTYNSGLGDGRAWLTPNRKLIMDSYDLFDLELSTNYANTYSVEEKTSGYYAQIDFHTELAGMDVRGDLGVRHFSTDQITSGSLNSTETYLSVSHNYSDTLPSLNLTVEPLEDFLVRFSYSEGISRAGLGSITPATKISVAGTNMAVSGSNPFLDPTKAKSYDLGFEYYFGDQGSVGLTLFKKDVESYAQTIRETHTLVELAPLLGLSPAEATQAAMDACNKSQGYGISCNENLDWQYSVPQNSPGGELKGFELSYQQPFTFLPGFWSNFGFIGSYTHVSSDLAYLDSSGEVVTTKPLIDLSNRTSSATLYYEDDKFSARVSVASRSGYLTTPVGRNNNDEEGTNGTTNVDMSLGYQLNDNIKFTLEALNLTNEVDDQWVGSEDEQRLSYYHETGTQYYVGVRYKF